MNYLHTKKKKIKFALLLFITLLMFVPFNRHNFFERLKINVDEKIVLTKIDYRYYYTGYYGVDLPSMNNVIVIDIFGEDNRHKISIDEGVSKNEIIKILESDKINYSVITIGIQGRIVAMPQRMDVSTLFDYDILDYVTWDVYLNDSEEIIQFDFRTGDLIESDL